MTLEREHAEALRAGARPIGWGPPLVAALSAFFVAAIGGQLTDLGPWYIALIKPDWQPPGAAFPIVWTIVFTLCAISGALGWRAVRSGTKSEQGWLIGLFALNGGLNVLWSGLFFTLQRPDWALVEVVPLWLSIIALQVFLWPRSKLASALLAPYVIWVAIAAVLNWEIVDLNAPFG
ncbi:MAG: tryptophan-rich sensory protein [Rhodobacteraceae bacterium]|nr:tryptophan-rich sensory protein [Paracoccaceae bacterium]